jgi:formylglycine-generating enzyme
MNGHRDGAQLPRWGVGFGVLLVAALVASPQGRAEPASAASAPSSAVVDPAPRPASASSSSSPRSRDILAGMVLIEGGAFEMGAVGDGYAQPNEGPVHRVTLAAYELDRTEVTVGAYQACVASGACVVPRLLSAACSFEKGEPTAAMNCVSYSEADRYCVALDKRLPTEAEWEHAATPAPSDSERPDRKAPVFPWGTAEPDCAHAGTLRFQPCDGGRGVGRRPLGRSAAGIDDLAGNLQEWVADFYDDRHVVGPSLRQGVAHVLRGGHYRSRGASDLRVTARSWGSMVERGPTTGFRCARSANHLN